MGTASVGAAAALVASLRPDEARVVILGTPAEEGHGGKIVMVREGCFDDIDVASEEGEVLEAPPSTWLVAPLDPDATARVRFRVTTSGGTRFVVRIPAAHGEPLP